MQVPRSAIGRTGMCPSCNTTIKIKANNTVTAPDPKRSLYAASRGGWWRGVGSQPTEDAKRKFGEAVDLFYNGRHGEALAIFDMLNQQFPGNPDIENGRQQCLNALRKPQQSYALEDHSGSAPASINGRLDKETVRRIVLEKMLRGRTEEVQLQAADIAAQLLGMYDKAQPEDEQEGERVVDAEANEAGERSSEETGRASNGASTGPDDARQTEAVEDEDEAYSEKEKREPRVGWGGIFEL